MEGFFNALSDFLSSDFAKNNILQILVLQIAIIIITVFVTSLVFNKLIFPLKAKKSENIIPEYKKLLKENKKIRRELRELKCTKSMLNAADQDYSEKEKPEEWEKEFLKR